MPNYRNELLKAKQAYKAKDYQKSYEIYNRLYDEISFDNSTRYSYAWSIFQAKIREYSSKEELLKDAELVTQLTKQNNLNHTQLCVYTMSVKKVIKLLYSEKDYQNLPYWLDKLKPELLDQVRFTKDGEIYPSNMEHYYIYASVTYFKLAEYEKCIEVSKQALGKLNRFTGDNAEFFMWRIAKSLRRIGEYEESLKFLKIIRLDEWYVEHEIAENYYYLNDYSSSLKHALNAAVKDGPMDMKINLYSLLSELLVNDYPDMAVKHEELCDLIHLDETDGKKELENELLQFWNTLLQVDLNN